MQAQDTAAVYIRIVKRVLNSIHSRFSPLPGPLRDRRLSSKNSSDAATPRSAVSTDLKCSWHNAFNSGLKSLILPLGETEHRAALPCFLLNAASAAKNLGSRCIIRNLRQDRMRNGMR